MMKILLVDHETYRMESLTRALRNAGYEVFQAMTLSEALTFMKSHCMGIDLIVSDSSMRILAYPEMLESIQERLPRVRMVMMVDGAVKRGREHAGSLWPIHFISKPFTEGDLLELIESLSFR